MKLETDLNKIKKLSEQNHQTNWNFRSFLKGYDATIEKMDSIVYAHRPKDCHSYPHLHKKEFVFRLWGVVENCSICPIVFNVYEQLKDELRYPGDGGFADSQEDIYF